jgi:hypothetical protein
VERGCQHDCAVTGVKIIAYNRNVGVAEIYEKTLELFNNFSY